MQSLRLETSSIVYGTFALIIFLFPYFMYAKEFFGENGDGKKGEYFSVIGKVVSFHILFIFFAIVATSLVDIGMSARPEFSPSLAMKTFYHTDGDWKHLIEVLVHHTASNGSTQEMQENVSTSVQIFYNYYGIALAVFFFMIPVLVLGITFLVIFKKNDKGELSIAQNMFSGAVAYSFVTFLVWFHAMFASAYVSIFTKTNFSFYKIMTTYWHKLLLG